jgi:hypothetical protein
MYIKGELVVKSYKPLKLVPGMYFIKGHNINSDKEFMEIWALTKVPNDPEEFMLENGAPVELCIIDEEDQVLATHEEIGWMDFGDDEEYLHEFTTKEMNIIFNEYGGFVNLEIEEEYEDSYDLAYHEYDGRVILSYPELDYEEYLTEEENV